MREQFFFCYDWKLNEYLKEEGIIYITKALHPKTKKPFTLYQQSDVLDQAIKKYNKMSKLVRS